MTGSSSPRTASMPWAPSAHPFSPHLPHLSLRPSNGLCFLLPISRPSSGRASVGLMKSLDEVIHSTASWIKSRGSHLYPPATGRRGQMMGQGEHLPHCVLHEPWAM